MSKASARLAAFVAFMLALATQAAPLPFAPNRFNVFSTGNIGTSANPYTSDFQGIAGSVGDFYVQSFSFNDLNVGPTDTALYAGGNAGLKWGSTSHGGLEVGGNIDIDAFTVGNQLGNVSIRSGGNINVANTGIGASNVGTVSAAGTVTRPSWWQWLAGIQVNENTAFTPTVDVDAYATYFKDVSEGFGSMGQTTPFAVQYGNQFSITLNSGVNVIELTAAQLANATDFVVAGPADASLVINVLDQSVNFDSITWNLQGGVNWSDVLVNLPNATQVQFSGGNHLSLLAPLADTEFTSGLLIGNLVVGNLRGGGQINAGQFDWFDEGIIPPPNSNPPSNAVPEPATAASVLVALTALALRRRR
jgi:choice-of-anchor A domain-containing protein